MFRNNKHEIHMVEVNKVALNVDDDKQICNGFITRLNESRRLLDAPFSQPIRYACPVLVAS